MIQEANYVFIGVLNILANNFAIIQYSFHSCLLFLDFNPNNDFLQQWLSFFSNLHLKFSINFNMVNNI